ncbi:hypothetical protein DTO002I6_8185 [Penicillium roqueforti]|nr:hypothetical protein DTO002I6_8185 [Penicillium roqueforti]
MYHDETPFNVSTSFPYVGVQADCPYGPTYAPLMRSAPTISPASGHDVGFQQAQSWLSAPAPSTVTQSPGSKATYREIRPKPPHSPTPTSPLPGIEDEEKHKQHRVLGRRIHSKHRGQLGHEQVQRTAKKARRTESEVTDTATLSVGDNELSTVQTAPILRQNAATQVPSSSSPVSTLSWQQSTVQDPVEAFREALKVQVLQSLRVLRQIASEFPAINLELETLESWMVEIEGVDATITPIASNTTVQVLAPFESLNSIFTKCITASGPMRGSIIRDQALDLLYYVQTYADKYHLVQNPRVYFDIVILVRQTWVFCTPPYPSSHLVVLVLLISFNHQFLLPPGKNTARFAISLLFGLFTVPAIEILSLTKLLATLTRLLITRPSSSARHHPNALWTKDLSSAISAEGPAWSKA